MTASEGELMFSVGLTDDSGLFDALFSPGALIETFEASFVNSTGKGTDRLNGFQFSKVASATLTNVSEKCLSGKFRLSPYLETLKTKGRDSHPRLISIPTIRDRVVLHQLNRFLASVYPKRVPKNIASTYIREITTDLQTIENFLTS